MAPPYQQVSLTSGDTYTKTCPRANGNRRCQNKPVHKLQATPQNDKEEFIELREDLLNRFSEYDEALRAAKCTRLAKLSCCRGCDKDDNLRRFRDIVLEDLRDRNAARGPSVAVQAPASSTSTTKRGVPTATSTAVQINQEFSSPAKPFNFVSVEAELQAVREECCRLAKVNEGLIQEVGKYQHLCLRMKDLFTTLQYDVEDLVSQEGEKRYKSKYFGLKKLIDTAATRAHKVANSGNLKKERVEEDGSEEDEDSDEDDES